MKFIVCDYYTKIFMKNKIKMIFLYNLVLVWAIFRTDNTKKLIWTKKMKHYKYHYIYRITNVVFGMHYYGSRSTNLEPRKDLGKKYFSSSTEKWFRQDQKDNPTNYKYKIIKIYYTCRYDAILYESRLHYKFDVKNHTKFYNKTNQLPRGFDTTGKAFEFGKVVVYNKTKNKFEKIPVAEIISSIHIVVSAGKVSVVDNFTGFSKQIDKTEFDKLKYSGVTKGQVTVYDEKIHKFRNISKEEFDNGTFITPTTNTVTVYDKMLGKNKQVSKDEFYKNDDYEHCTKDTVCVIDTKTGERKRVQKTEYYKNENDYVSIRSKKIIIYDSNSTPVFETFGNFKKVCVENNLPFGPLTKSYQNGGTKIYSKVPPVNKENTAYINWYAKVLD